MQLVMSEMQTHQADRHFRGEALLTSFDLGFTSFFTLEWLLDRVERDEWGGLWW